MALTTAQQTILSAVLDRMYGDAVAGMTLAQKRRHHDIVTLRPYYLAEVKRRQAAATRATREANNEARALAQRADDQAVADAEAAAADAAVNDLEGL